MQKMKCETDPSAIRLLLSGGISAIVLLLLLQTVANLDFASQLVRIYGCVLIAFMVELALYALLSCLTGKGGQACVGIGWYWGGMAVGLILCSVVQWQTMPGSQLWKFTSPALLLAFALCLLLLLAPTLYWPAASHPLLQHAVLLAVAVLSVFFYVCYCYVPNLLNTSSYTQHHFTAVSQSIYNAAFSIPYTVRTTGMYGHYAIFFWPFLKLFGHEPQTVAALMAFCGVIAQLLFVLLVCTLVRSTGLRVLAILAGTVQVATGIEVYYQMWPLRYLWPLAVLLYLLSCLKNARFGTRQLVLGYLLCCLATVWNTETGLVSIVAFTAGIWLFHWQTQKPLCREMLPVYGKTVLGAVVSVAGMVAIINAYNLLCGGQVILKACFFPLIGGNGYVERLETDFAGLDLPSLIPIFVFFVAATIGLSATRPLPAGRQSSRRLTLGIIGMMGFGFSYYYFNRTIAGTGCVYLYLILCVAMAAEAAAPAVARFRDGNTLQRGLRCGVGIFSALFLCIYTVETIVTGTVVLSQRCENLRYSQDSLRQLAGQVEQNIPANTYAFGYVTQEIYGILGWDPGYHQRDVSDVAYDPDRARERNDVTSLQIQEDVNAQDAVLIWHDQMAVISENTELVPEFGIPTSEPVLYYCTRNAQIPSAFDPSQIGRNSLPVYQTKAEGVAREHNGYLFCVQPQAMLLLNAAESRQAGLQLEITVSSELFAQLQTDHFTLQLLANDTELGEVEITKPETTQSFALLVPSQQLPQPDEDGLYRLSLVCNADQPLPEETTMYWLDYLGPTKDV